jgi:hypothetical protein
MIPAAGQAFKKGLLKHVQDLFKQHGKYKTASLALGLDKAYLSNIKCNNRLPKPYMVRKRLADLNAPDWLVELGEAYLAEHKKKMKKPVKVKPVKIEPVEKVWEKPTLPPLKNPKIQALIDAL